ncbi:hypothetical protein KKH13_04825 [Patescibacteria group bacterium]|uniref:Uncharacterized protein n=1 Tax=viral metagenome TaxID=1070528 RepID=A0A6M3KW57_9ZZZZ|nr:hypothetical protein [Patescibacteria group bacterium]
MADITSKLQGNVSNEGKVNWRGDQVTVAQGGQSIYDSSSVALADLGERKVVGDRVFRYAKAKVGLSAGQVAQFNSEHLESIAFGSAITQGAGIRAFTITAATAITANTYAEGYLVCAQGATDSNLGMTYRIKSHALGSSAGTCALVLYDEIKYSVQLTSTWGVTQNIYAAANPSTANQVPLGVAPITVTTGDYFWLQTWGPAPVLGTCGVGAHLVSSVSGRATVITSALAQFSIGSPLVTLAAATNYDLVFLTIAP